VISPEGAARQGAGLARIVFGPTCDSIDRLPEPVRLPADMAEEDYLIFAGMGAYSHAIATRFNGYGPGAMVTVAGFAG
jgi:ornithine decarboxylase